jgi:hypothetical protein
VSPAEALLHRARKYALRRQNNAAANPRRLPTTPPPRTRRRGALRPRTEQSRRPGSRPPSLPTPDRQARARRATQRVRLSRRWWAARRGLCSYPDTERCLSPSGRRCPPSTSCTPSRSCRAPRTSVLFAACPRTSIEHRCRQADRSRSARSRASPGASRTLLPAAPRQFNPSRGRCSGARPR